MGLYKRLLKDIVAFALGNMGSKILSFLLVPLYTYFLTTEEYGNVDFITVTIQLVLPVITLSISSAVLRFCMCCDMDKEEVLKFGLQIIMTGIAALLIILPIIKYYNFFYGFELYFCGILIFQSINELLGQYTKGSGRTAFYSSMGILQTGLMLGLNILFIVVLQKGINGYYLSVLLSYASISFVYIIGNKKDLLIIRYKIVSFQTKSKMLKYSLPLIPNSLMWWVMNAIDRYFIIFVCGMSENGLYAVANKIPTILNTVFSIFNQAWQLSVMGNFDDKNSNDFYQNIWESFLFIMTSATFVLIIFSKKITTILYSVSYYAAWKYTPILLLSMYYSIIAAFFGTFYLAKNKTSSIMCTSFVGALVNFIMNMILIPIWGCQGAGIATATSYFIVMMIRIGQRKSTVSIILNRRQFFLDILMLLGTSIFILNYNNSILILIMGGVLMLNHRLKLKYLWGKIYK